MSQAPQSEIQAIALFNQLGRKAVEARFDELSHSAQVRLDESYCIHGTIPVGFTALNFMTNDERTERHQLLLVIQLCTDSKAEVYALIMARRTAMKSGDHAVTVG